MAGMALATSLQRLKTLACTSISRRCIQRNTSIAYAPLASIRRSYSTQLTDPTKDPKYLEEVERFKNISNPDEVIEVES